MNEPDRQLTPTDHASRVAAWLRPLGSLWLAAVVLATWVVALAAGTILETRRGAEYAQWAIYSTWWFQLNLWLLVVNVLSALALRFPYHRRQVGFVISHLSILLVLAAACITDRFGISGQIRVPEGRTVTHFANLHQETLTILSPGEQSGIEIELAPAIFGGLAAADRPMPTVTTPDGLRLEILSYLPDSTLEERVQNDAPQPRDGVEVVLVTPEGRELLGHAIDGDIGRVGPVSVALRQVADDSELPRLLGLAPTSAPSADDRLQVEIAGRAQEIPLSAALREAVPAGETGYTVRVLRYLPHAEVADDGTVHSVSDLPANPVIEAELIGPSGAERRWVFARFPEFDDPPDGRNHAGRPRLTLLCDDLTPGAMIEVLLGPGDRLHVRFLRDASSWTSHVITVGEAVPFPLTGWTFAVRRVFDHARLERSVRPVEPPRAERTSAVKLRVSEDGRLPVETWVQKYLPETIETAADRVEIAYTDQLLPLGFSLTLDRSCVVRYPGEDRPRSFESHVTVSDPAGQSPEQHVISMNRPLDYGEYSLFQFSSSANREDEVAATLGVARDPGRLPAFAGYIGLVLGMIATLATRSRRPSA